MTNLVPGFEEALIIVAEAHEQRRGRRAIAAKAAAVGVGATLTAAGAAYATGIWSPQLGFKTSPVQAARSTVPADQQQVLAVLRRAQLPSDRVESSRESLRLLDDSFVGVHVDGVRHLGTAPNGGSLVLVPAKRHGETDAALCLWLQDPDDVGGGGGFQCGTTDDLRAGKIVADSVHRPRPVSIEHPKGKSYGVMTFDPKEAVEVVTAGLVPDSVARVHFPGRGVADVIPQNNAYAARFRTASTPIDVEWLDSGGHRIER